jgi:Signal transduction histidine kinase
MSHELRTPLNAIIGYAQMLKRDARFNNVPGLKTIEQSGNHLLSLINDILDIAKIESGNMEIYPNIFHFYSFLDEICNIIRVKAEEKDVYFKFQADKENLPEYVNTDEKRLRQILLNLLSNAVKFTHKGGVTFRIKPRK